MSEYFKNNFYFYFVIKTSFIDILLYLKRKPISNIGNISGSKTTLQPIPVAIILMEKDRLLMTCTIILSVYLPVSRKNNLTLISADSFGPTSPKVGSTSHDDFFLV